MGDENIITSAEALHWRQTVTARLAKPLLYDSSLFEFISWDGSQPRVLNSKILSLTNATSCFPCFCFLCQSLCGAIHVFTARWEQSNVVHESCAPRFHIRVQTLGDVRLFPSLLGKRGFTKGNFPSCSLSFKHRHQPCARLRLYAESPKLDALVVVVRNHNLRAQVLRTFRIFLNAYWTLVLYKWILGCWVLRCQIGISKGFLNQYNSCPICVQNQ